MIRIQNIMKLTQSMSKQAPIKMINFKLLLKNKKSLLAKVRSLRTVLVPLVQMLKHYLGWELTEKNLKKARRKIKNKISAQESRKRKRDYVNNLEERISDFTSENQQLKRDLEKERSEKKTLMSQVRVKNMINFHAYYRVIY